MDEQCLTAGGAAGSCEPTGFCSFPDKGCASGRRYGTHAGDGLAGACAGAFADAPSGADARPHDGPPVADGPRLDARWIDAAPDAPPGGCDWSTGPVFVAVEQVAALSSTSADIDVSLSPDGLTAFVSSFRPGGSGLSDIWEATRGAPDETFA